MNNKYISDLKRDDFVTTGQMAKILGISKSGLNDKKSYYSHISRVETPFGILWSKYEIYKHLLPRASDDLICQAILDDRAKIQIKHQKKKEFKHA